MLVASYKLGIDEIKTVVNDLKSHIKDRDIVIFLHGDLAAGKTTFVQNFSDTKGVTSPTFSLQNCYEDGIYHYDLYNIDMEKFFNSGLIHELEKPGIHFIEWADEKLKSFCKTAGFETMEIEIKKLDSKREYRVYGA